MFAPCQTCLRIKMIIVCTYHVYSYTASPSQPPATVESRSTTSFGFMDPTATVAEAFPAVYFVH
ncbi:MAG: hypothetical protein DYG89_01970 [Caldilinea sp. CFX5]|nr:hypothetical protein [Caldilinea sp. CFX5]